MASKTGTVGTARPVRRPRRLPEVPLVLVYILGFVPAAWTFYQGVTDQLGAEPIKTLEQLIGLWALKFLIASLCVTPLRQLTGISLLRYRRALGLLAFYYTCLHLLAYMVLDQGLDWAAIGADIIKRPYITVGMAAFAILVPLAITSNNLMLRRLGGPRWLRLHRLVYAAAALAPLHYLLVVKSWPLEPLIYTGIIVVLLAYRLWRQGRGPRARRAAASM